MSVKSDKSSYDITFKKCHIIKCVIKVSTKFYPQLFLDRVLYDEYIQHKACKKDISKELMPAACQKMRKKK